MTVADNPDAVSGAAALPRSISVVPALLRQRSIRFRLAAISALLLGALAITSAILIRELYRNSQSVAAATEYFERLEAANDANEAFGDIRYWMTDLAVSQLTLSERNAKEARSKLTQALDRLAAGEGIALEVHAEPIRLQSHLGIAAGRRLARNIRLVGRGRRAGGQARRE